MDGGIRTHIQHPTARGASRTTERTSPTEQQGPKSARGHAGFIPRQIRRPKNSPGFGPWSTSGWPAVREYLAKREPVTDAELRAMGLYYVPASQAESAGGPTSWWPKDLKPVLEGEEVDERPSLLLRTDGEALLYPGKL